MIDLDLVLTCRICLEEGAMYPIFESNEEFESVYAKLPVCIKEKLENIEGYPRSICLKCKNTSDVICSFMSKFEETCKILEEKIVSVKIEKQDSMDISDNDDHYQEPFVYQLAIDNLPVEPQVEKRDPTKLLESLKHLTVKKIKVENDLDKPSDMEEKKKKGRPRKKPTDSEKLTKNKKNVSKSKAGNKAVTKLAVAKENGESKPTNETANDNEKVLRVINSDKNKNDAKIRFTSALCDLCGEIFKTKEMLQEHILKLHTEKKFKCPKCPKAFTRKFMLKYHLKLHDNIRDNICDLCGKGFFQGKTLNEHIRYVHNKFRPQKTRHKCKFCDRNFSSKRCVLIHERSVHTGERPEVCSICNGRFYDHVYLKQHMLIHTGEAPFKCPVCNRGYSQLCNMKSHMRNHKVSDLSPELLSTIKPNYIKFMRP